MNLARRALNSGSFRRFSTASIKACLMVSFRPLLVGQVLDHKIPAARQGTRLPQRLLRRKDLQLGLARPLDTGHRNELMRVPMMSSRAVSVRTAVRTKALRKPVGRGQQRSTSELGHRPNLLFRGTICCQRSLPANTEEWLGPNFGSGGLRFEPSPASLLLPR
jgi:hypothetical protein